MGKNEKTSKINKSAKDGKIVTYKEVKKHPNTTYVQTVKKGSASKTNKK